MEKYQQGDLLLCKKDFKIKGLKKLNHLILANGSSTGHKHQITKGDGILFQDKETNNLFLNIKSSEAELTHEEHKTIFLPKGKYQIKIVREFDHFLEEARRVED